MDIDGYEYGWKVMGERFMKGGEWEGEKITREEK